MRKYYLSPWHYFLISAGNTILWPITPISAHIRLWLKKTKPLGKGEKQNTYDQEETEDNMMKTIKMHNFFQLVSYTHPMGLEPTTSPYAKHL